MNKRVIFAFLSLVTSVSIISEAQVTADVAQGQSPYGVYQVGNIDSVNVVNGNLSLHIPLLSYPQRGKDLRMDFYIFANDKKWYIGNLQDVQQANGQSYWEGQWMGPVVQNQPTPVMVGAYVARDQDVVQGQDVNTQSSTVGQTYNEYTVTTNFYGQYVLEASGAKHYVGDYETQSCTAVGGNAQCPTVYNNYGATYPATDGTNWTPGRDPNGITYGIVNNNKTTETDTNGNQVVTSPTGWTDTIGRSVPGSQSGPGAGYQPFVSPVTVPGVPGSSSSCPSGTSSARQWVVPAHDSSSQTYYLCYSNFSYQTAFNVSAALNSPIYAVAETSSTSQGYSPALLLSAVVLPNGTSYTFSYDQYLSLTKVTLPTGGSLVYTWQNIPFYGYSGSATPVSRAVKTRTLNPGNGQPSETWTYHWYVTFSYTTLGGVSVPSVQYPVWAVVTDPAGNDEEHQLGGADDSGTMFSQLVETKVQNYVGCGPHDTASDKTCLPTSGTLLKTASYVLSPLRSNYGTGGANAQTPSALNDPLYKPTIVTTTVAASGGSLVSKRVVTPTPNYGSCQTYYNLNLQPQSGVTNPPPSTQTITPCYTTSQTQSTAYYDFGKSSPGALLKTDTTNYQWQTSSSYLNANLINLVSSTVTTTASGATAAQTTYAYDENNGSPQGALGNLTSVTRTNNVGSSPKVQTVYNTQGMPTLLTDANGNKTSISYQCSGAFPQTVTTPYQSSTTSAETTAYVYDCNIGKISSVTDPNHQPTSYTYNDSLNRLTKKTFPDTGWVQSQYNDAASPVSVTVTQAVTTSTTKQTEYDVDGLGRLIHTRLLSDSTPDITDTNYDNLGRIKSVSNPYRTTSDPSYGTTQYSYDALSRKATQTQPDGSALQWCYNGISPPGQSNCAANNSAQTSGIWTDYSDESGHHWQQVSDGLGRLTAVLEPDTSNTPDLETDYGYDVLGNLVRVDQWGGSKGSSGDRVRTFSYDLLSRLITSSNPENGTVCYGVWSGSNCVNGYDANSNLVKKTDARGITTTFSYDALNRLTSKSYSDGTQAVAYGYDGKDQNGTPISGLLNPIGRLSKSTNSLNVASIYSYDPMGRINSKQVCVPGSCNYSFGATATYDLAGNMTSSNLADGVTISTPYDTAGRLSQVTIPSNNPVTTLWSNPTYSAVGLTRASLGNGLLEETAYDNRARITAYAVGMPQNSQAGGSPPFGSADSAVNALSGGTSIPVGGFIKAVGWAASNQDGAPIAQVELLLDGKPLGSAILGGDRPDVAAAYNQPSFTYSGWNFTGSIGNVATGTHTITAVAYDWNQNSAVLSVSSQIQITVTSDSAPAGSFDTVSGVATGTTTVSSGGLVTATGWAADNEDGSPVSKVVILLDGQPIGNATLGGSRPDVAAAYNNSAWGKSGWNFTGSIFGAVAGTHTITAAAYDSSGNQTVLNSDTITVVADTDPINGSLDSVTNASNGSNTIALGGNITAKGWAAEPDQNPGAPLSRVEIDIDGQFLGVATLGVSRSDVESAYGRSDYLNSGYTFTGAVTNIDPGEHEVEARAYTHSGGSYVLGYSGIVVSGTMPELPGTVVPTRYSYSLNYAPGGNIVNAGDSVNGNWSYTYDNLNRLTSAMSSTSGVSMTYDAFGNRWQQTVTAGTAPQFDITFNTASNHIDGNCYDAAGNVLDDGPCVSPHKNSYDAEGRLISGNYGATTYLYDADGFRVAKQSSGSTSNVYFYDVAGRVGVVTDGALNVLRTELYAGDRHLATYQGSSIYYTHSNWLGTEAARSDGNGNLCETISSLPFGDYQQTSGTCSPTPAFYTGKERDSESGNDYFGARYYASTMGRFLSPDEPFANFDQKDPQSLNMYSYVQNNPLTNTDPDGHDVHVCVDNGNGGQNCFNATDEQWKQIQQNSPGVQFNLTPLGSGTISCGGTVCGSAQYFEPGLQDESGDILGGLAGGKVGGYLFGKAASFLGGLFGRAATDEGGAVIGRTFELGEDALGAGERKLNLPDLGDPKSNWAQNSSRLREAMAEGKPIRDAHVDGSGNLIRDNPSQGGGGAFLKAERNLLENHGWTYNPSTTSWYPPNR